MTVAEYIVELSKLDQTLTVYREFEDMGERFPFEASEPIVIDLHIRPHGHKPRFSDPQLYYYESRGYRLLKGVLLS